MILGLAILISLQLLGIFLETVLRVPLPGPVLGMMLLALGLFSGFIKLRWVEQPGDFLLRNMMLFFIPLMVGISQYFGFLSEHLLVVTCGIVGSTLAVLLITGYTVQFLARKKPPAAKPE